ncbi:MAG TPA: carboxypeptidase regulatory-like domain-containing protein [Dokdonella sp.]|uniref:carboxypeptidase regulatory-like domain-containing protein n=1 Tax=Dokdonella sp. TaxID=2291710 RepID=UPI002BCE45D7|nr:carboxypeptidase regulatory-like domain-containing protein [Dokdonella sp.]HUD41818.1 carboxypeptidase regulatory-like domain-containing protein [Dokdonella sp.]
MNNSSKPGRRGTGISWRALGVAALTAIAAAVAGVASPALGGPAEAGVIVRPQRPGPALDGSGAEIDQALLRGLQSGTPRSFVIEFKEQADLSAAAGMDWQQRGRYVYEQLRAAAERAQAPLRSTLRARGATAEAFWIKNAIVVRDGDIAALQAAAASPQVKRIRALPTTRLVEPVEPPVAVAARGADTVGDNLSWVGADRVWAQGTTGAGVTVGLIDTAVFFQHEALVSQYRGNLGNGSFDHDYNWLGVMPEPYAGIEQHGTHVLGTILGDSRSASGRQRIGMAPDAQWIACDGFPMEADPALMLLRCGQFMLAPHRRDGSGADPDKRPQVVNNSWSEGNCDGTATAFYADMIDAWVAAGIFPAFAAGNTFSCGLSEPPGLSSLSSPAALGTTFAIGSTGNHDGAYAVHSLWGPTADPSPGLPLHPDPRGYPQLKPQVVAPGVEIRSALIDDAQAYGTMTGTSMSTPHVTGLVALMIDAAPCLAGDYATLGGLIMQTARPIPYATGGTPSPGPGNVPNYATGWGEIDAVAAVDAAAGICGPTGSVGGQVSDAAGRPVAGATVTFLDAGAQPVHQTTTDGSGQYVRRLPAAGATYGLRVSAYGYLPYTETGIVVTAGQQARLDVVLPAAPSHKVSGIVTDAATGWPLHARITVVGAPLAPIWTDPSSGRYSLQLAEGASYRLDVEPGITGYRAASRELGPLTASRAEDLTLEADAARCAAPGYAYSGTSFGENFESGALPPGWTRSSQGIGWLFGSAGEYSSNYFAIPEHGRFAVNNDELGPDTGWANDARFDYLVMPAMNLSGLDRPALRYRSFHTYVPDAFSSGEPARVEASTDGGATWVRLGVPTSTTFVDGWTDEAVDLTPVIGPSVLIRFHADDLGTDEWDLLGPGWAIDDVAIRTGCTAPANGALIVGQVRDANTALPLDGAQVRVDGGAPVTTRASADPSIGSGYYAIHAPAGAGALIATPGPSLIAGYGEVQVPVAAGAGTERRDLGLPAGRLRLYPERPSATVELGTTGSATMTVSNTGGWPLTFGFEGVAVEEHFEDAFPPAGWTLLNHATGCTWTRPTRLGNYAGGNGLPAGIDLWDCRDDGPVDTSLVTLAIDLSGSATASMGFFVAMSVGADSWPRLDVDASIDGGATWTTVHSLTTDIAYDAPHLQEIDLSAFAGHAAVQVRFHYTALPPWGYVMIDQVHLFNSISKSGTVTMAPDHGPLAAGESRTITVGFDARSLDQPGVYPLAVRVAEDTPYEWPFGDVEAVMTVTAPAHYGSVGGVVRGLGSCDLSPLPIAGATVHLQAGSQTYTTRTAADGSYRYWLPGSIGTLSVTIEADGHLGQTRPVTLSAGVQTPLDFDLRLLAPCLLPDPGALSAFVQPGQTLQRPFDLLNAGPVAGNWQARAGGDPSVLVPVSVAQTNSLDPEQFTSVGCVVPATGYSLENRYFRVFQPAELPGSGSIRQISGISFAIDSATSPTGTQPLTVRLHQLAGPLSLANMSLVAETVVAVTDDPLARYRATFDTPAVVAPSAVLVAELHVPIGTQAGTSVYPGGNTLGGRAPAYWASASCGLPEPVSMIEAGYGWINFLIELDVLDSDPCGPTATAVPWLSVAPGAGNVPGDGSTALTATLAAGSQPIGLHRGSICLAADGARPAVMPVTLNVATDVDRIFSDGFD